MRACARCSEYKCIRMQTRKHCRPAAVVSFCLTTIFIKQARAAEEARSHLLELKTRVADYEAAASAALRQVGSKFGSACCCHIISTVLYPRSHKKYTHIPTRIAHTPGA